MLTENFKNRIMELAGLNRQLSSDELNLVLKGYIECALWTEEERLKDDINSSINSIDGNDETDDESEIDKLIRITNSFTSKPIESFSREDIEDNSLIQAYSDIKKFIELAGNSVFIAIKENGLERLGHDIWLTRNHHGAGFFDHSYDDNIEKQLISSAHALKDVDLYVNDNMQLTFSNAH